MDIFESKLRVTFPDVDWSKNLLLQLSSISVVTLVVEVESHFKIEIHPMEVNQENFASFDSMMSFINKKKDRLRGPS